MNIVQKLGITRREIVTFQEMKGLLLSTMFRYVVRKGN